MAGKAAKATANFFAKPGVQSWLWYGGLPLLAFIVASPGMILNIAGTKDCDDNSSMWFSGQTSFLAVLLQAFLFVGLLVAIWKGGAALKLAVPF